MANTLHGYARGWYKWEVFDKHTQETLYGNMSQTEAQTIAREYPFWGARIKK